MPWLIGIDEAGYGPNLAPMVQTSTPLLVPDGCGEPWDVLAAVIRRCHHAEDGRLLIDDSKQVYDGHQGFHRLERGVLAAHGENAVLPLALGDYLKAYALEAC